MMNYIDVTASNRLRTLSAVDEIQIYGETHVINLVLLH